jgi:hypothetical protein
MWPATGSTASLSPRYRSGARASSSTWRLRLLVGGDGFARSRVEVIVRDGDVVDDDRDAVAQTPASRGGLQRPSRRQRIPPESLHAVVGEVVVERHIDRAGEVPAPVGIPAVRFGHRPPHLQHCQPVSVGEPAFQLRRGDEDVVAGAHAGIARERTFFGRRRARRVVGQAPRRDDLVEGLPFGGDVEVAGAQPTDVEHQTAFGAGHLAGRLNLCGRVEQPEPVLARLRRQRQRAAGARSESLRRRQCRGLVHDQQPTQRPLAGGVAFDPRGQQHPQLVDESLPLLVRGQADHADHRDPRPIALRRSQQLPRDRPDHRHRRTTDR